MPRANRSSHLLETVSRACGLIREISDEHKALTFSEIVRRTGIEQTICFRLLRTLEHEGFLSKSGRFKYVSNVRIMAGKSFCIGYAAQGHDPFSLAVGQGLRWAANEYQVDLIEMDNQHSQKVALRNAKLFVKQNVNLAIEFQAHERFGRELSGLFKEAAIPVIAVEIPQPGASFFGVDNHEVGRLAGKALLRAAQREWNSECDELLLLERQILGSVPHLRISSAESVLQRGLSGNGRTTRLESRGEFVRAFELTRKHLQMAPRRRTLLIGTNDLSVLGALRAFEEAGRSNLCLAAGFGAIPEARRELRLPNTRLIGTVAFFPERYGERLLKLAMDVLHHREVPPAVYADVAFLTARNIDQYYPKEIFGQSDIDLEVR